jgi:hypothetical protein
VPSSTVQIYGPSVTATGATFTRGDKVHVSGSNFAAGADLRVFIDEMKGAPAASSKTDGGGLVAGIDVVVPTSITSGKHRIIVVDALSQYPVSVTVTIN